RNLRAVTAIIEDSILLIFRAVEQPFETLDDHAGRGALIEHHADVVGVETRFLQQRAHEKYVVDAAFESIGWIRIIVDADQQGAASWFVDFSGADLDGLFRQYDCGFRDAASGSAGGADGQRQGAPDNVRRVGMPQVLARVMVENAGDVELRVHLFKIGRGNAQAGGKSVVVRIEEVKPVVGIRQRFDAAAESGPHKWVSNLRTEGDEGPAGNEGATFCASESVVTQ